MTITKKSVPKIKVLMIGPGENIGGGICALIETFLPCLKTIVNLRYFPTVIQRPMKECGKVSLKNLIIAFTQYFRFLGVIFIFKPQIVHIHTSQSLGWLKDTFYILMSKLLGYRVVLHMHGGNFNAYYTRGSRIIQWYTRNLLRKADIIIAVSQDWQFQFKQNFQVGKLVTLLNCVNLEELKPHIGNHRSKEPVYALFLGRVGPLKGAFDLIEGLGILASEGSSLYTWIAGDEERPGDLLKARTRLADLGLEQKCELLGNLDHKAKNQFLQKANIFLLPSYSEVLPMALLEAMASGLPVIVTPVGGIPELVLDGTNGFLISPGDINSLADRLSILVSDIELREKMGRKSREIAEQKLDVEHYVRKLNSMYVSLVR